MADKRTITQPDQLTLYPTPSVGLPVSRIDNIIAEIRNRISSRVKVQKDWWCIDLSRGEFEAFEARFKAEADYRWPKYDYFPQPGKFVLRMAGPVHNLVVAGFQNLVKRQLFIMERSNDRVTADFARGTRARRSPKIEDEYILGSRGRVQVVIGIDLEYRKEKGKEARVTVWRPRFTFEEDGGEVALEAAKTETGIFRAADGSVVDGERILRIGLKDFGYWPNCLRIDDIPGEITISFSQLHKMVQQAEQRMDRTRGQMQREKCLKRRMAQSPPQ
ncbi:hypothetical protein B0T26DRAFT_791832 [Lasiosphaeria miniovina]|uniref:Uncharacterized protein n=1 Tax=Lasiosphaeria miniovina TaxID=1954250 RepID=A0AA39ZTB3_9PEZI|nr:uncharacterized protein B0T26DRAFT_791832 [Lasiosphaeria miniovina]KAK0703134.1 hypothetical protein B0T26DRAFT_791832 [Lasiosphaeria miniovina]